MTRIGVERRVHTSGRQKAMLDPFLPEKPDEVEHLKSLQEEVHATFVSLVRARRPSLTEEADLAPPFVAGHSTELMQ